MSAPHILIEALKPGETSRQAVDRMRASVDVLYTHSSVTHKAHLVGIALSNKPIGLDLEVLAERDVSLFDWFTKDEWELLGGQSWLNFYKLWTAKEAVIKKCQSNVDAIKEMRLVSIDHQQLIIDYHDDQHGVQIMVEEGYVYGYTV